MTELVLAFLLGGLLGMFSVFLWAWLAASKRAEAHRDREAQLRAVLYQARQELEARQRPQLRH